MPPPTDNEEVCMKKFLLSSQSTKRQLSKDIEIEKDICENRRLFVGNLPFKAQGRDVWSYFEDYGPVKAVYIIRNRCTHESKGSAFVSFHDKDTAQMVLKVCHKMRGKPLIVSQAVSSRQTPDTTESSEATVRAYHSQCLSGSSSSLNQDVLNIHSFHIAQRNSGDFECPVRRSKPTTDNQPLTYRGFNILALPQPIIEKIFSYFDVFEQMILEDVCPEWKVIVEGMLKSKKVLRFTRGLSPFTFPPWVIQRCQLTKRKLATLLKSCTTLRSIDFSELSGIVTLKNLGIKYLLPKYCRNLQELYCYQSYVSNRDVFELARSCRYLTRVSLAFCSAIGDKSVFALFKYCKQLTCMNISGCSKVVGSSFRLAPPGLAEVNLCDCSSLQDIGIYHLSDGECRSALRQLNVTRTGVSPDVLPLISRFTRLESLSMFGMTGWLEPVAYEHLSSLRALTVLDLSFMKHLDDTQVLAILRACRHLEEVYLSGSEQALGDTSLALLAAHCPRLRTVDLSYRPQVTDVTLRGLATAARLTTVYLVACPGVSNAGVVHLAACRALAKLDVSGNYQLTTSLLTHFHERRVALLQVQATKPSPVTITVGGIYDEDGTHAGNTHNYHPLVKVLWNNHCDVRLRADYTINMFAQWVDSDDDVSSDDTDIDDDDEFAFDDDIHDNVAA